MLSVDFTEENLTVPEKKRKYIRKDSIGVVGLGGRGLSLLAASQNPYVEVCAACDLNEERLDIAKNI